MGFFDKIKSIFKKNKDVDEKIVEPTVIGKEEHVVNEVDEEEVTVESLAEEQKLIDDLYNAEGLSDRVLDMQVALNQKRNKYDISDKTHLNSDGWSQ